MLLKPYCALSMNKFIFIIPLLAFLLTGCKQQELLKGLDQGQANEVVALLQHNNILASKSLVNKEGYVVSVGRADFAAAVDLMNIYSLPSRPRVEIAQMFPADTLVSSPVAERARLYSAIEQRLEQSLLNLSGVVSTSVHVSYNLNADDGRRQHLATHVSALVKYDDKIKETTLLINDVKRFIKNSFENVEYENISVVVSRIAEIQRITPVVQSDKGVPLTALITVITGILLFIIAITFVLFNTGYQHHVLVKLKKYLSVKKRKNDKNSESIIGAGEDAAAKN